MQSPLRSITTLLVVGALLLVALAAPAPALALEIPASPEGRVSDYAGVLSAGKRQSLEAKLAAIEGETGNQFAVAIFQSLEGEALEDYSIRLADKWKIGQAGKDNGLIVLLFMKERKIRIEVGYGLEGAVPDVLAGRVIREVMGPKFREGDIAGGIYAAVVSLDKAARGDVAGALPKQKSTRSTRSRNSGGVGFIVLFIIVGFINLIARARYGASMVSSRRGASIPWWMWLLMLSGGSHRRGGGGFGGGGFGGGGFGGGGGGFGGGGASGGW
jgi:uncharacterized protein